MSLDLDLFIRNQSLSDKARENLRKLRESGVSILKIFNAILENLNIEDFSPEKVA